LDEGQAWTFTLTNHFSDSDSDTLTFSASSNAMSYVTARVSGSQLTVTGVRGFTSDAATITVTARDPGGLSAQLVFAVTVSGSGTGIENRRPIIRTPIADANISEGQSLVYSLPNYFSDPDGDTLSYSVQSNSTSYVTARVSGSQLTVTGVRGFTSDAATITVTARDPRGLSVQLRFFVRVAQRVRAAQRRFGAIAHSFNGDCSAGYSSGIAAGYSDRNTATSNALDLCRRASGTSCRVIGEFGSGFSGDNQCGALAYGENSRGCGVHVGSGATESAAESAALSRCRNAGFSCTLVIGQTRGGHARFARCAR